MPDPNNYIVGALAASGERVPILPADRRRHVYIVGQTGTGKTGLLFNLMRADMEAGRGFCFLDPHGDASQAIAAATPRERTNQVIYLDPSDPTHTFAYNPLAGVAPADRATSAANIVSAFKNIWGHSWGPRLEYVLSNALRLLLDNKDQSLIGMLRLFVDDHFRRRLLKNCADPVIRFYWQREFEALDSRQRAETLSPIQNKIGVLLANPFTRSVLCQNTSTIDIADAMNTGNALIVNLSKGNLGSEPAHLLGALLITAVSQAAEARRNIPEDERRDFTLYVDEFQNFATDSFASILSEARKWRLSLVAANQHVAQLPQELQHAVFGNAGTIVAFRVGAIDAPMLAAELGMESPYPLRETNNFRAWLRLMREGTPLDPHLIDTLPPEQPRSNRLHKVIARSRSRHAIPRSIVEAQIKIFFSNAPTFKSRNKPKRRRPDG
jgi:Type IV secretion-system coupling protein DNA-binding domain